MSETATAGPVATGRLEEQREGMIVLGIAGTDYRLHLLVDAAPPVGPSNRLRGEIHCTARRVDVVPSGGRFVEPSDGRPRQVQGRVIGTDAQANALIVQAAVPVTAKLGDPRQKASQFEPGQLVTFAVERGARFVPIS